MKDTTAAASLTVTFFIIIIITRPKPAYGRQGLAGLWGQDTDEVSTLWGVFNINRPVPIKTNLET